MRVLLSLLSSFAFLFPSVLLAQVIEVSPAELYAGGPAAPAIISMDMPLANSWYQPQDVTFHWGLPIEVVAVAASLHRDSGQEPMDSYRPPTTSIKFTAADLIEGAQYLSAQFKNAEKWGPYTERQILIDGTPPEPFTINIGRSAVTENKVAINFATTDRLSGVAYYEVRAGSYEARITPNEAKSELFLTVEDQSEITVEVTAYDMAGNSRQAATVIYPMTIEPTITSLGLLGFAVEEPASILAAIMASLLLIMFGYMVFERQRYASAIVSLREESEEAQTQIMRIFNALRSEIYDQINAIDGKTRLSKREKEAVSELSNALKVSEKLLKKEVKDIKKLL